MARACERLNYPFLRPAQEQARRQPDVSCEILGSSEEFVGESGESVAANPPANRRGLRPCDPLKTKTKTLLKKKEQEAICALPLVGNRARHVVGRFQVASGWTPVGSEPPPQNGLWNEERRRRWNPRSVPPGSKMWLLTC